MSTPHRLNCPDACCFTEGCEQSVAWYQEYESNEWVYTCSDHAKDWIEEKE